MPANARESRSAVPILEANRNHSGRICIFTSAHPTDDVRVYSKIACSFLNAGYSVSWIGPSLAYFAQSVEVDERIKYHLLPPASGRLGRLAAARRIVRASRRAEPVDWWYSPDPDAARLVTKVANRRGGKVMLDIHEIYHGALLDRWLPGSRMRILRSLVRGEISRICRRADLVIGVSTAVLRCYVDPQDGGLVIRNCAPSWFVDATAEGPDVGVGPMRVVHGKVIPSNGTTVVLDALIRMKPHASDVQVLMFDVAADDAYAGFVHSCVHREELQASVEFMSGVPHPEMPALLASADVGMIAYGRGLGEDSLPNRLFEYMAAGLAILAPTYAVEICQILASEDIGVTADFDDPADVARALTWLHDHAEERRAMGTRARQAFLERHSWQREFEKLLAGMREVSDA